ncbi:MAG: hypothetical protein FWC27_10645 [Firmicutes bacterium]|nr:hypothetical protein [Bacillota bacterium]
MSDNNTQPFTAESLLEKLDLIVRENDYLRDGLKAIGSLEEGQSETASALVSIVQARETTNQRIIALYARMYEDLRSPLANEDTRKMEQLRQAAELFKGASATSMGSIRRLAEKMLGLSADEDDD